MNISVQNGVARATFSNAAVVKTETRGAGVTIELAADNSVVAASFNSRVGAMTLARMLPDNYDRSLSDQDVQAILGANVSETP